MKKHWVAAGAGLLIGIFAGLTESTGIVSILQEGALGLGQLLRSWSLSGPGGNAAAWAVCAGIALLPIVVILLLRRKRRQRSDMLWPLAGLLLFIGMYFLVNPTLMLRLLPTDELDRSLLTFTALLPMGAAFSLLLSCVLLRWAGGLTDDRLILWMRVLLAGCMALTALTMGQSMAAALRAALTPVAAPSLMNAPASAPALPQLLMTLISLIPDCFFLMLLSGGMSLLTALSGGWFRPETGQAAAHVAQLARRALSASVLTLVAENLLTLLLGRWLPELSVRIALPLTEMALSCGALLLARLFTAACLVQRDNDLMI